MDKVDKIEQRLEGHLEDLQSIITIIRNGDNIYDELYEFSNSVTDTLIKINQFN